jgi:hypothetical protein
LQSNFIGDHSQVLEKHWVNACKQAVPAQGFG